MSSSNNNNNNNNREAISTTLHLKCQLNRCFLGFFSTARNAASEITLHAEFAFDMECDSNNADR